MSAMENLSTMFLALSETLRKETSLALLKAAVAQERTELVLEKHGLSTFNYRRLFYEKVNRSASYS